jgi:hypothetical protein
VKRTLVTGLAGAALSLPLALVAGAPASAASPKAADPAYCVSQGLATLRALGALEAAQRQQVNYADFDVTGAGLIRTELGDEYYAPLGKIVALHAKSPGLFAWCDR